MTAAPSFRDRLVFHEERGALMDETRRYMLIRPDALMGMFRRLPDDVRAQAFEALADSIFEQGSDSASAYRAMGAHDAAALLGTVAATAPHLGWGRWRFDLGEGSLRVSVENSPFAAGYGPSATPVCYAIVGMLRAVSTIIFGRETKAQETACAACGAPECRFEARVGEANPPPAEGGGRCAAAEW